MYSTFLKSIFLFIALNCIICSIFTVPKKAQKCKKKNEMPTLLPPMSNHCHSFASNHITTLKSETHRFLPTITHLRNIESPIAKFHRLLNFTESKISPKINFHRKQTDEMTDDQKSRNNLLAIVSSLFLV